MGHGYYGSTRIDRRKSRLGMFEGKYSELTEKIIGAFYRVYNKMGYGFSEKIYENALVIELRKLDLPVEQQRSILVYYDGNVIGEYLPDIVVDSAVIVEAKAVKQVLGEHEAQLLNYLKATPIEVGLLMNFGPKAQYIRKVYDKSRKGQMTWVTS